MDEQFRLIVAREAKDLDEEPGGYEAVLADPVRLDLQVLAEDQALLALPLVPRHPVEDCDAQIAAAVEPAPVESQPTQKPFGDLRDLMRKR